MVEASTRWKGNIQAKSQWRLVGIILKVHLGPLGRWSKNKGEGIVAEMGIRLNWTHMQRHPREKELFCMCPRVHTKVTKTVRWRAYEDRLGN